jgi:competence protein ComEC
MYLNVLSISLGVIALHTCQTLPGVSSYLLLLPAMLLLRWRVARPVAMFACGFFWAAWQAQLVMQATLERDLEGKTVYVEGVVLTQPQRVSDRLQRFLFAIERLDSGDGWNTFNGNARLNWYAESAAPLAGERWRLAVRLKQPHGFSNPGGFDYEGWLFQQRIRVSGYVRTDANNRRIAAADVAAIERLRHRLLLAFDSMSPRDSLALIQALTIGDRGDISGQQWSTLNATGTTHLMAISGLHISLVAGLMFALTRTAWSRCGRLAAVLPATRAATLFAIAAAACYACLSGFGIPARRALVMVTVFMLALLANRDAPFLRVIVFAVLVTLLIDPLSVLSAGWWLSFWAVLIIAWMGCGRVGQTSLLRRWLLMHVVLALGMLPLLLVFFQQASLIAPLANMVAVPLVGLLVVPLALFAVALFTVIEPAGIGLLEIAATLIDMLWPALQWLASLPHAAWTQHQPVRWTLLPAIAGLALLLMPRGIPGRSAGLVLLLPLLLVRPSQPAQGEVRVTLLDVGQGLAAVVQTASHALVYDAGPRFSDSFDTGQAVVVPFLRRQGVTQLDALVVSHGDNDHIGGVASLLAAYPARRILSSVPGQLPEARAKFCRSGDQWQWDGVYFAVLHPAAAFAESGNNGSCVLHIEAAGGGRLLLAGDIERAAEQQLLREQRDRLGAEVLVVPHHGSNTSSSAAFISAVAPTIALFPTGYLNRYRMPRPEVLARYQAAGVRYFETGRDGALTVRLSAQDSRPGIVAWREQQPRYWRWHE